MAVKYAIVNGNWADGTTWNDGVVPTSGDYVYCNGKTISFPTSINIGNGTISNQTKWKDLTEPRTNPFIILTDADLNNLTQYPSPDNVRRDIEYAYGEKVGTLDPVNTTNTINVYPYKRRNNF